MNFFRYLFTGILTVCIYSVSCQKNKVSYNQNDLTNPVSIYPAPASKWIDTGGTAYYSSGYLGDVMPYFENGKFHVFYLHDNRDGASGYNPIHALSSADMVHFQDDGLMIRYGAVNDPDHGIGAGSLVKVGSTYYLYYCGNAFNSSTQNVVYATSPDMKTWTKKAGFVLNANTAGGYDVNNFRDPYVFFNAAANAYWMLVSSRLNGAPVIALYTTADPSQDNWTLQSPFYTADNPSYFMTECPQVFQWGQYWYLVFSEAYVNNTAHYRIGASANGPWTTPAQDVLDGAYFYAGKMATDGTNHYLFGWTYSKAGATDDGAKVWGGNLVTHQLMQNADGTLLSAIPDNVSGLFSKNVTLKQDTIGNANFSGNDYALKNNGEIKFDLVNGQKKIMATISGLQAGADAGFEFALDRPGATGFYKVRLKDNVASIVRVEGTAELVDATIPFYHTTGSDIQVSVVIDNTIAVVNINGKTTLTDRIYWMPNASWGIYSHGGSASFKSLQLLNY